MTDQWLKDFIRESNRIENIEYVRFEDTEAHMKLLALEKVTVADLQAFVSAVTGGHRLRDAVGLDVRVGSHLAPVGGPEIYALLNGLLRDLSDRSPFENHLHYELLHPFTDGNGRSGRALWLWQMRKGDLVSRQTAVEKRTFLEVFADQAMKAGHDPFTYHRGFYYSVLDSAGRAS